MGVPTNNKAWTQNPLFRPRLYPQSPLSILSPKTLSPIRSTKGLWTHDPSYYNSPCALKLHRATKDHLDLRLCHHTLALSWAFYLLPSHCPDRECVAVQTEDHLRENILFEGVHPEGQYGAGPMIVLSKGSWRPLPEYMDVAESKWLGCLRFFIECPLMRGAWTLIRNERTAHMKNPHWMLRKEPDEYALSKDPMDILDWTKLPSCLTGQTIEEMEHNWHLGSRHLRASGSLFVFDSTH